MTGKYRTIVADPPWSIERRLGKGGRRKNATEVPYEFMSIEDIKALPVATLAADDSMLFMWATRKVFREGTAAEVARSWGFEPCGEVIWGLRNPGMGSSYVKNDHEPLLIAKRGGASLTAELSGVWYWRQFYEVGAAGVPQKVHSAKPEGFFEQVEQASPGPRVELFARTGRLGWDHWGDQSLGTAQMEAAA